MIHLDALVIGAGFSGLYQLLCLRERLGLSVKVMEAAPDLGCIGLVGAGPLKKAHENLRTGSALRGGAIHRCVRCLTSWLCGPGGWARADDDIQPSE